MADVRTNSVVSADITGSFRELVSLIHDEQPLTAKGRSTGSAFNLRVEPLDQRLGDPSRVFSSRDHGDPATPLLEAYLGDPLVLRTLVPVSNEVHSWHLDGHWFRTEVYSSRSPPTNTVGLGISERFDLSVAKAGGPQAMAGDYLYYNGRTTKLLEGSWGIVRVHEGSHAGLQRLPGHENVPRPASRVCPKGSPQKRFAVSVIQTPMTMLAGSLGKVYVLDRDVEAVRSVERAVDRTSAEVLFKLLMSYQDRMVVLDAFGGGGTFRGPVSYHLGLLAPTMGRPEDASSHLEVAQVASLRFGAAYYSTVTEIAMSRDDATAMLAEVKAGPAGPRPGAARRKTKSPVPMDESRARALT